MMRNVGLERSVQALVVRVLEQVAVCNPPVCILLADGLCEYEVDELLCSRRAEGVGADAVVQELCILTKKKKT